MLEVACQAPKASDLGKSALHDLALGRDFKSNGGNRAFENHMPILALSLQPLTPDSDYRREVFDKKTGGEFLFYE